MLAPDVAFVRKERMAGQPSPKFAPMAPDLAVEVVSPEENVMRKVSEYITAGTRLVWTVYVDDASVYVCRPTTGSGFNVEHYGIGDTLDGGEVLPGFTLPVNDIFPDE